MGQCWTKVCTQNDNVKSITAELGGENVHLITTLEKWEEKNLEARKAGKIVAVNFSTSWSNPCREIAPSYSELADKYPSILFLTVDVDKLAELTTKWDIKATPSFFFLRDGRQLDKLVGSNKEELQKKMMAIAESN
ncbi:thioredoxin H4-1-like [Olea europaea subsp. europaea]|uniref:Thioredoxin H4-1-like n=1 Tax=Olea europaea subsp. europaea TaxID=158383 RepID=A0A8S0PT77_OLEEU|nr:thioredoxin H4-1-like [Olea europaea subsp. europaea]